MNTQSDAPLGPHRPAPAAIFPTRPMYWSIRRELWENRSIYIAPLAAATIYIVGFMVSLIWIPHSMHQSIALGPAQQLAELAHPYAHAGMLLMLVGFIVGIFYSLDALHGERRDRGILFWKSLPVSDLTTVLSKASIPLIVLPLIVFALTVISQIIIRLLSTLALLMKGLSASPQWTQLPLFQMELVLLYGLAVLVLWHAPIYCWFILVSGWARRATFLWAVLPPLAVGVFEWIAFRTSHFGSLMHNRMFGFVAAAFDLTFPDGTSVDPHFIPITQLTPGRFLSSPGLWIGLLFAAIFLGAAVHLRRYQGPI